MRARKKELLLEIASINSKELENNESKELLSQKAKAKYDLDLVFS